MAWISLHNHSQFSILDSTISISDLAEKAKEREMSSIALTDSGNMFGAVDFYKACTSRNIKPIIGCEVGLAPNSRHEKKRIPGVPNAFSLVLLAKNEVGYKNLCKISSIGYVEGFYYRPRIDKEVLLQYKEGLIALSGSIGGKLSFLAFEGNDKELLAEVQLCKELFGEDFYIELQRHAMSEENMYRDRMTQETWVIEKYQDYILEQNKSEKILIELAKEHRIKCVATNDIHYMEREDWKAHEILLNIQSGEPCEIWERDSRGVAMKRVPNPKRKVYSTHEFYFKTPQEMEHLFSDVPEAVTNTLEVADKCNFSFDFHTKHYPVYTPPYMEGKDVSSEEREKEAKDYLYRISFEAIGKRYSKEALEKVKTRYPDKDPLEVIKARLDYEFEVIASKGMCDYLLIVYDFIAWAKSKEIPVGPGRGSAAGSIIAYLIGITDIEPLRFQLFFERFINPERISYPDIDVDICMERRQEVIDYTIHKYGKDRVAQIITFGTMKAKMAIKDVGRVLSVSLAKVNAIAKLVPEDPNMTLEKALNMDPELRSTYETDDEAKMIIDMAKKIEGSIRNTSIHAAGIIISAIPITDHVPVCIAKDSEMIVTQYSMKPVELIGMLKIDFLGLKTLTSIQKAVKAIYQNRGTSIDTSNLFLEDSPTFNLLNQGKTLGVFQLESGGMQELSKQLHIDHFEEIIAVTALYRPGPMDMIPSFINRKKGKEAIEIDHPLMKEILEETYGVMVYQEQVMQIASKLGGYSLGEGDVLRRAMGKKDKKEMERQREKFLAGALERGIDAQTSSHIFEKIEKFASYGFNKSHAAAYAYLSYVTAYLKANYSHEWMAALMTCDRDDLSKVAKFICECNVMGIAILPPDINEAGVTFAATSRGIRFAMSGIKGVGTAGVEAIVEERNKNGPFKSLQDFIHRIDKTRVGKKNIELLIDAGAFDFVGWTRDELKESVEISYDQACKEQKEAARGVLNFFSLLEDESVKGDVKPPKVKCPSSQLQILQKEKELLGFYLTSHPMDSYQSLLKHLSCIPLKELEKLDQDAICRIAFIVDDVKVKISSKTQKKFAILTIGDGIERFELPVWNALYEESSHLLVENQLLYAIVQIDKKEGSLKLQCKWLDDLTKANEEMVKKCDEVYDQLKNHVKSFHTRKKNVPSSEPTAEKKSYQKLFIEAEADLMKLSHILQLKDLFRKHPGKTTIEMHFLSKNQKVGALFIDSQWGVQFDEKVGDFLKKMSSIRRFELK